MRSGNCCTNFGVCITPFDIARIISNTGLRPEDFVMAIREQSNRERAEPAVLIDGVPSLIVLKWQIKRVCKFYGAGGCTIYNRRPRLCRTYPFTLSARGRLVEITARACPAHWMPVGPALDQYLADLAEYKKDVLVYQKIAGEWNKRASQNRGGLPLADFLKFISSKIANE